MKYLIPLLIGLWAPSALAGEVVFALCEDVDESTANILCSLYGQVFSPEDCECQYPEVALCEIEEESAQSLCAGSGMVFNAESCSCAFVRYRPDIPKVSRPVSGRNPGIDKGVVGSIDDMVSVGVGPDRYVQVEPEMLDTAVKLAHTARDPEEAFRDLGYEIQTLDED